ncbi:MAG: TraB/GumN family protein, partial [Chitinophagaceae bacterium]
MSSFSLRLRTSFFLLLIVAATAASAQSASLPKTLLWRISGKGLARPSYLWGTVHIKDRRVFRFTDSLYRFLETSDGYAMELDPEEATATVVRFYAEKDTTPLLRDLLSPADFKRVGPKLEKELGIAAEAITQRRAWMYLQDHADLPVRKDDMPEAMDVYLYTIARSKQKVVTGIEDLKDQFDPAEEMKTALDVERLLKHNRHEIGYYEDLVRVYVAQDLNRVEKMTTSDTAGIEELVRRNRKMARRLDSLMALRPTFFTMGAAHLPGSDGVISLLRARGFTVEPVLGGRKVDPSDYHFERAQIGWVRSQNDSASFSVETPGAIAPVGTPPPGMSMSVHADVHTEMAYFLMDFLVGGDDLIDSVIVQRFALLRQGKKKAGPVRRLLVNGRSAYEMLMEDEEKTHYRVRGIGNGPEVILLMIGTQDERELKSADAERFFGSLKILRTRSLPLAASSNEPWQDCSDSTRGYSVQFPGAPEKDADMLQQLRAADAGSWRIETRSWFDATNSRFYVLAVRETLPGYIITDPNSIIEEAVTNLKARPGISITNIDTVRR